ncbi:hypothetical protein [Dokdonella immobilis]|uniref:DUF4440 domain-containing protein n=1 Tax=Dokdonella immobilis TaxID=578942 RepID=A0A1I4XVM9_9GAMM|nr:hypothetical protein [Dokdonella immobilis]SFN29453.1 hypothetical protein SAMN05216289_11247 [Dokdonella immobilis]
MHVIAVAALAVWMLAGATPAPAQTTALARQRADELLAADKALGSASAKTDGLAGLTAAFAEEVSVPVPGKGFARGKTEVIAALRANPALDSARIDWAPVRAGISADGSQGFTYGFMTQRLADGSTQPYKYLAYWRRDTEGWHAIAWKRARRADGKVDLAEQAPLLPGAFAPEAPAPALDLAEKAFSDDAQTIGLGPAFAKFGNADSMNLGGAANAGFVFGAEAIARLVSEGQPAGGSTLNWSADRVVVAASGDLGLSIGHIRFNERAEDGSERPAIPFFTVWRRAAPDQPWRYIAE